jgi:hypothetical protein
MNSADVGTQTEQHQLNRYIFTVSISTAGRMKVIKETKEINKKIFFFPSNN